MFATKTFLAALAIASGVLVTVFGDPITPEPVAAALQPASPQAIGLPELSEQSEECVDCHRRESVALFQQWGSSRHYRANVGCYECHKAEKDDPDVMKHYGYKISVIVSPKDCARCHSREVEEFLGSRHARAGRIAGSPENLLAEVVEGNRGFVTEGFPEGVSAAAVSGCWKCHGSPVRVLEEGRLDPAGWPNVGIGRQNPDGTEGSCTACHTRHEFSVKQARHPAACGRCHLGPDHSQKEIYEESKHGITFHTNVEEMKLGASKWVVGEEYWAAPTCATCHMSATRNQPVSHDTGRRISWNNRPVVSVRPDVSDKQMGLPGRRMKWKQRREGMKDVCLNCHNKSWVESFYIQYDALIALYTEKYAGPGEELYNLAGPLLKPTKFSNRLDIVWFELWHHEGRRARHAASMMGPDYTHWHGTYDLAMSFYFKYVPELQRLVATGLESGEAGKITAAQALQTKLDEVLNSENHKWFLGQMDPEEAAARARAEEEFKTRYKDE